MKDYYGNMTSIAASGTWDIRPLTGEEIVISNIFYSTTVDFIMTNGNYLVTISTNASTTPVTNSNYYASNDYFYRLVNKQTISCYAGFNGVKIN
jgi:hypothetical protein